MLRMIENNGENGDHGEDAEVEDDGEDIVVQMKIVERKKEKISVSRNRRKKRKQKEREEKHFQKQTNKKRVVSESS